MMPPSAEKRSSPRTTLHQLVAFERTALGPAPVLDEMPRGVGRDISDEGLSLLAGCPLYPGEVLRLHLPVEAAPSGGAVLSEVRWSQVTRHGFRVGLHFLA